MEQKHEILSYGREMEAVRCQQFQFTFLFLRKKFKPAPAIVLEFGYHIELKYWDRIENTSKRVRSVFGQTRNLHKIYY